LLTASQAIGSVSLQARETMPELDYAAWAMVGVRIATGGAVEDDARWFSIRALLPATLGWLRAYRT
jgi:hypothetical protein